MKKEKPKDPPPFMYVDEAAKLLGVSRYRLRQLVNAGRIRARCSGPGRRISRESIEKSGLSIQLEISYEDIK